MIILFCQKISRFNFFVFILSDSKGSDYLLYGTFFFFGDLMVRNNYLINQVKKKEALFLSRKFIKGYAHLVEIRVKPLGLFHHCINKLKLSTLVVKTL